MSPARKSAARKSRRKGTAHSRSGSARPNRKAGTDSRKKSRRRTSKTKNVGFFRRFVFKLVGLALVLGLLAGAIYWFFLPWQYFERSNDEVLLVLSDETARGDLPGLLLFLDKEKDRVLVQQLDPELKVELIGGYGTYQLRAAPSLLALDGKDVQYQRSALSLALGLMVDRVVVVGELPERLETSGNVATFEMKQFFARQTGESLSSPADLVGYLELFTLSRKIKLADAEKISFVSDLETLDRPDVGQTCSIAVINTTETSGLARSITNLVEENGGIVVRVGDSDESLAQSEIAVRSDEPEGGECAVLADRLALLFPQKPLQKEDGQKTAAQRANIVISIGSDFEREVE